MAKLLSLRMLQRTKILAGLILPAVLLGACSNSETNPPKTSSTQTAEVNGETVDLSAAVQAYNEQNFGVAQTLLKPMAEAGDVSAQFLLADMLFKGQGSAIDLEGAVNWYQKAAKGGSEQAQYQLAMLYSDGTGVPNDEALAIKFMKMSADQNHAPAQYMLGLHEFRQKNTPQAVSLLMQAAENGSSSAQHLMGEFYARGENVSKDMSKAIAYLNNSAQQNNKKAQTTLGFLYTHGEGVEANKVLAADLFYSAAVQGYMEAAERLTGLAEEGLPEAQHHLGLLYRDGKSFKQNSEGAKAWMLKAAEQNFAPAQFQVAEAFGAGRGGEQDYVQAHMWMNLSAAGGYDGALERRGVFAKLMTREQLAQAQKRARDWTSKFSANQ